MKTQTSNVKAHMILVDPQNDFVDGDDGHGNKGTLVVPGAKEDMRRVAHMLERIGDRLADIHVTLDSHQEVGIERPRWWKRVSDGAHPDPFTILGIHPDDRRIVKFTADVKGLHPTDEEYTTYIPSYLHSGGPTGKGEFGYLKALAAKKRYPHVVWPVHCVVGSWGWGIVPELSNALRRWESQQFARVDYVTKGNHPRTEHFSGVMAEVPDPSDPATQINTNLIQLLEEADIIAVAGEALSHCVANSARDVAACFSDPKYISKMTLLEDASSNVPGFEHYGTAFIDEMRAKGMKTSTTDKFLA